MQTNRGAEKKIPVPWLMYTAQGASKFLTILCSGDEQQSNLETQKEELRDASTVLWRSWAVASTFGP
jgi:hypothetical protein